MKELDRVHFRDKRLRCCDCGENFTFTAGEQLFYWSKKLSDPRCCPQCRRERRLRLVPDQGRGQQ